MKSIEELEIIKKRCEKKRNGFEESHSEYKRLSINIESLVIQIRDAKGDLESWLDSEREDGNSTSEGVYLGDGVYM